MNESRILRYFDAEMRAKDGNKREVEGYALKFDTETQIGSKKWGWVEKIKRTALDGADLSDVVFNFNHDMNDLLAGTRNKSLDLTVDDTGLKIVARIADTTVGRDVYRLIKDGLICRMSFMAVITSSEWVWADDNTDEMDSREVTGFGKFYDVSAVTFPAYEDTELEARGTEVARSFAAEMQQRTNHIYQRQLNRMEQILGGKK